MRFVRSGRSRVSNRGAGDHIQQGPAHPGMDAEERRPARGAGRPRLRLRRAAGTRVDGARPGFRRRPDWRAIGTISRATADSATGAAESVDEGSVGDPGWRDSEALMCSRRIVRWMFQTRAELAPQGTAYAKPAQPQGRLRASSVNPFSGLRSGKHAPKFVS